MEQGHGMTVSAQAVSVLCRTPVFSVAMQISYFHVPAEMPQDLRPDAAVVIDVLRATTTIAWSLHNGAEAVQAFASLDDLRAAAAAWPADARLLLGERGGQMLEGFDLGNSPVAVTPERVAGKRLFMSTTNGTRGSRSTGRRPPPAPAPAPPRREWRGAGGGEGRVVRAARVGYKKQTRAPKRVVLGEGGGG